MNQAAHRRERIPVGVLIEHGVTMRGKWTFPKHTVLGVVSGEAVRADAPESTLVREEGEVRQRLWRGLELCLYADGAESYWYNLTAEKPSLFVVCRDEDGEFRPVLVTADHDEGAAHTEVDDLVFAVAIPPEVHQRLERFVVENYRPEPRKKRRHRTAGDDEEQF